MVSHGNVRSHDQTDSPILPSRVDWLASQFQSDRLITGSVIALAFYALVRNLFHAAAKPLWFDELQTEAVCGQPNLSAIWNALKNGADGSPPLFYVLERWGSRLSSNEMIGYRLLPILAFSCTLLCLYTFVHRRRGAQIGFVCALLLFLTPLFTLFAVEARPYSALVASLAFALVAYQRLPSRWWTLGLFFGLGLAESLHHYALFAVVFFFAAELVYIYTTRSIRGLVWLSLLASIVPGAISVPLLMSLKRIYGDHFWARADFMLIPKSYSAYLRVDTVWGVAIAVVAFLVVLGSMIEGRGAGPGEYGATSPSEDVLVMGFIILPAFAVVIAKLTHGGATDRYYLPAILGIAAALGYVLGRVRAPQLNLVAALIVIAVAGQEASFLHSVLHASGQTEDRSAGLAQLVQAAHRDNLPVVVSDAGEYVEFSHDAGPALKSRMLALVDPENAAIYAGTDSVDILVGKLRCCERLEVDDFKPFAAAHPMFLLYSNGSRFDWWPARLEHDGAALEVMGSEGGGTLYSVTVHRDSN
jgi:hypothetical protein